MKRNKDTAMKTQIPGVKDIFILVKLDDGTIHQTFPSDLQKDGIKAILSTETLNIYAKELDVIEIERRGKKEKQ